MKPSLGLEKRALQSSQGSTLWRAAACGALAWLTAACASSAQGASADPSELASDPPKLVATVLGSGSQPSSSTQGSSSSALGDPALNDSALSDSQSSSAPSDDSAPEADELGNKVSAKKKPADSAAAKTDAKAEAPPSAKHCGPGMVFISGDYCSEVKHRCLEEWHSNANKKDICEQFEPYSKCVGSKTPKAFCIDDYSWPNKAGERPEVMNNFYQAQVKCAAVGKRLCTESEWTMACEGPEMKPFPYGYVRDPNICNGDREWDHPDMKKVAQRDPHELARLWQGVRSGSQPGCVSDYGVHDLPGNNDEVVSSETTASNFRGKFDSVHSGGPWYFGVRNQCRPKIYTHNEGFYYYFLGFRCCAEPDAAETDPRAPKQIQRGWNFSRVEGLARFTTKEMEHKLELKAKSKCTCGDDETLCKTMCGTLLGPEAKDAPARAPAQRTKPKTKKVH